MRFLLASLFVLTACASAPPVTLSSCVVLPLGPYPIPVVPAAAGAQRFDVLLDTGAARTVFDADEARRLGLEVGWRPLPVILTNGADHEWVWHTAAVDRLELGAARIEDLRAPAFALRALVDEPGAIAGLVGQDLFRSIVLVLDGERREVELVPAELRESALDRRWPGRRWCALELDYAGGCPNVVLDVGAGLETRLLVDTGAVFSSLPREILEQLDTTVAGRATMSGRIGGARTSELHVLEPVRIAGWEVELAVPAVDERGALGMDVLDLFPVAVDGPGRTLWIAEPAAGEDPRVETVWHDLSSFGSRATEAPDG